MQSKNNNSLVSVIILNYNGQNYLEDCLRSVLRSNYKNLEVILVDNGSTDDSLISAQKVFGSDSRVRFVQNKTNLGFSEGNNVGFEHSTGDYIVFLNNDTVVDPQWLTSLVDTLENDCTIGLAQSLLLTIDGCTIQNAGWLFSNYLVLKHALWENKPCNLKLKPVFDIPVASGASMITRRSLIDELGLFDPRIPFFYDDTLLSFKMWLASKRVVTVSNSRIRHLQGATKAWNVQSVTFNLLKAKFCLIFDVYYSFGGLLKALTINFLSISINSLFFLKRKNFPVIAANVRGIIWALRNFKYLWNNKLEHWSKRKINPKTLKANFVRVNLSASFYVTPSKLGNALWTYEVSKYENAMLTG